MKKNALVALAALVLAGCGNQTLVAGLFVNTPKITVTLPNPVDPSQPGISTPFGPFSAILGYVTSIDTSDITDLSSASLTPITGAQATLAYESCIGVMDTADAPLANENCVSSGHGGTDRVLNIPESGGGLYELLATDESMLTFEQGVTYTLILEVPDGTTTDAYGARFQPGPPAHMVEFANKENPVIITGGSSLTVTRDDAMVNGEYLPAAVLVIPIDPNNPSAQPDLTGSSVWKSFDFTDPKTLALFALSDKPYRVGSFTIDSSAFACATAPCYFVVTMISISEGTASANAFIGSTVLAGSGDAGLVIVQGGGQ